MSELADLYQTLGLSPDADPEAIKKAFRSKAKLYHPDTHPGDKKAEERFKELSQAHDILSDPEKRRRYDAMRQSPFGRGGTGRRRAAPEGAFGGGSVNDLFEMFFGRGGAQFGFGGFGGEEEPLSQDLESEVWVSFEDAALGRSVTVSLDGQAQPLRLNLPAGAEDGLRLRLAGQGQGPRGDLYLVLKVRPSERFSRQGLDVSSKARIHLAQALLGGTVTVPTLHGDLRVKVAPGTAAGSRLRLAGKGIEAQGRQGDHFVELEVELPRDLSPEEKEQVRAMAKARGWEL